MNPPAMISPAGITGLGWARFPCLWVPLVHSAPDHPLNRLLTAPAAVAMGAPGAIDLSQRPDVIRQTSHHGRRPGPPPLGRAAADVCAFEPERAARFIVDRGYTPRYDHALQAIRELPYNKWRKYDIEDTVRFYALRLQEAGIIKSGRGARPCRNVHEVHHA
jgi:hypothetical protein